MAIGSSTAGFGKDAFVRAAIAPGAAERQVNTPAKAIVAMQNPWPGFISLTPEAVCEFKLHSDSLDAGKHFGDSRPRSSLMLPGDSPWNLWLTFGILPGAQQTTDLEE